ncbi:MAG TPA: PIN domain-containing protein [Candidatus Micrarchaeia archaeon]|nr:PIN domain-containing protein [Candidatus Micrarchaeia archaeon]
MTSAGDDVDGELALADTSLFMEAEPERPLSSRPPEHVAVSVVTAGELRLGVLAAPDGPTRARRLATRSVAAALHPLPVDEQGAHARAALRLALRDAGRRMRINDAWIAATAIANDLALASQDSDYDDIPGVRVIRVCGRTARHKTREG